MGKIVELRKRRVICYHCKKTMLEVVAKVDIKTDKVLKYAEIHGGAPNCYNGCFDALYCNRCITVLESKKEHIEKTSPRLSHAEFVRRFILELEGHQYIDIISSGFCEAFKNHFDILPDAVLSRLFKERQIVLKKKDNRWLICLPEDRPTPDQVQNRPDRKHNRMSPEEWASMVFRQLVKAEKRAKLDDEYR